MVGDLIAIEILDLTINSMVMFHVAVYQRSIWLVVSAYPSEKYEFASWDDEIPNIWKNKKCLKPPISYQYIYGLFDINLPPR